MIRHDLMAESGAFCHEGQQITPPYYRRKNAAEVSMTRRAYRHLNLIRKFRLANSLWWVPTVLPRMNLKIKVLRY